MSSSASVPALTEVSSNKSFGGFVKKYSHQSAVCKCTMRFNVYLPPNCDANNKSPAVFWLSGLTCTENNASEKGGFQRWASELGLAIVFPDTSPRGVSIPGDSDSWDFGLGAGFYVNATTEGFKNHYRMYDYIAVELPNLVAAELPLDITRFSISGHSMGGHGALVVGLRNPKLFKCISAFAPICEPSQCPWGVKAFSGYLGGEKKDWLQYDAVHLLEGYNGDRVDILVDVGSNDQFEKDGQLRTQSLRALSLKPKNASIVLRVQHEYDHSYYFIASFIESHLKFHSERLVKLEHRSEDK